VDRDESNCPVNLGPQYAPGSTKYANIAARYGIAAAEEAYRIALAGGQVGDISQAMARYNSGADQTALYGYGNTSSVGEFFDQVTTDPLAAPLESANRHIGNVVFGLFKNPFVLVTVALLIWWKLGFPGAPALKKKFA
jgi:hypothetical protein